MQGLGLISQGMAMDVQNLRSSNYCRVGVADFGFDEMVELLGRKFGNVESSERQGSEKYPRQWQLRSKA